MKFLKGKNWFEFKFGRKLRKGLYVGPLWSQEKDIAGTPQYKIISLMTRRFKAQFKKDNLTKEWTISLAGRWDSDGRIDEYITYNVGVSKFVDKR